MMHAPLTMTAIIPARKGSKRIPHKNIQVVAGKPLISWVIETALESRVFEQVVVSTDCPETAEIALSTGAEVPYLREAQFADDFASVVEPVKEGISRLEELNKGTDSYALIYATAILMTKERLQEAKQRHLQVLDKYLFAALEFPHPIERAFTLSPEFPHQVTLRDPDQAMQRTQDFKKSYYDAGQWIFAKKEVWLKSDPVLSTSSSALVLTAREAVDIDEPQDLEIASLLKEAQV